MIITNNNRLNLAKLVFLAVTPFLILLCSFNQLYSADRKEKDTGEEKNNVFTLYGLELGKVDEDGFVYNKFGTLLGNVDEEGIVYNISKVEIGKVKPDGSIMNQIGTRLGSVNEEGDIINISGRKIGSVKDVSNIFLVGGVARLIFFKGG